MEDARREKVEGSINKYRPGILAGGADLVVGELLDDAVTVHLVIGPQTCRECLIPDDILQEILTTSIKEDVPDVVRVELRVVSTEGDPAGSGITTGHQSS